MKTRITTNRKSALTLLGLLIILAVLAAIWVGMAIIVAKIKKRLDDLFKNNQPSKEQFYSVPLREEVYTYPSNKQFNKSQPRH